MRWRLPTADNGYYVNYWPNLKTGPVPAELGPGLWEETDVLFLDGNSYRWLPPLLLLPPPDDRLPPPPPLEGRLALLPPE